LALEEVISQYWKSLGELAIGYPLVDLEEQFKKVMSPALHSYLSAGCHFLSSLDVVCTLASDSSLFQWQNSQINLSQCFTLFRGQRANCLWRHKNSFQFESLCPPLVAPCPEKCGGDVATEESKWR